MESRAIREGITTGIIVSAVVNADERVPSLLFGFSYGSSPSRWDRSTGGSAAERVKGVTQNSEPELMTRH